VVAPTMKKRRAVSLRRIMSMKAFLAAVIFSLAAAMWMNLYFNGPGAMDAKDVFATQGVRL
jgi:hypothetical protein